MDKSKEDSLCLSPEKSKKFLKTELHFEISEVGDLHEDLPNVSVIDKLADQSRLDFSKVHLMANESFDSSFNPSVFLNKSRHSIIPFLLTSSKDLHLSFISDDEVNKVSKLLSQKKSTEYSKFDFYKLGLISLSQNKIIDAHQHFQNAFKLDKLNENFKKWYLFSCLIILFCRKSIRFADINKPAARSNPINFLFSLCSARSGKDSEKDDWFSERVSTTVEELAREAETLLLCCKSSVELLWMMVLVGTYQEKNKEEKLFFTKFNVKSCIAEIRKTNKFLALLVYLDYHHINDRKETVDILNMMLNSYKFSWELVIKAWDVLYRNRFEDKQRAFAIVSNAYKTFSRIQLVEQNSEF